MRTIVRVKGKSMSLEGKIALVTGGGRGIGREIAKTLARRGAYVIVNYNGSEAAAAETVKEIESEVTVPGAGAKAVQCNVADFAATEKMVKELIAEFGKIDILVNNAGITRDGLVMRMSEAAFDDVISTNLKGAFNCIRHVSGAMVKKRSGRIINISSVTGIMGNAGQANYAASKAGIIGLTKSVARELSGRGITSNAVAPGFIVTEMTDVLSEQVRENIEKQIPLGRFGHAADVANTVAFLASDEAAYITGQVICVDGGMAM